MGLTKRYTMTILLATLVPVTLTGLAGLLFISDTAQSMLGRTAISLARSERSLMRESVRTLALNIDNDLRRYRAQIDALQDLTIRNLNRDDLLSAPALRSLYPDRERADLPAYGYVHPVHGAYANWEQRLHRGSPWIRRSVVERVQREEVFRRRVSSLLDRTMPLVPVMQSLHARGEDTIDLLWIVTVPGVAVTFPNDYAERMRRNATFNELDESQEDYVRLLGPEHNPERETRWSVPYRDVIKHVWMVSCIAPLYEQDRFLGTVGVDILLETLTAELQEAYAGEEAYIFLTTPDGSPMALPAGAIADFVNTNEQRRLLRSVFSPDSISNHVESFPIPSLTHVARPEVEDALQELLNGAEGLVTFRGESEDKVLAVAKVEQTGWCVGLVKPLSVLQEPVRAASDDFHKLVRNGLASFFCIVVVTVLAGAAVGAYLGVRTTKPVHGMIEDIDRVGRGGDWHEVSTGSYPEFQRLADSVNRMVAAIRQKESRFRAVFDNVSDAIFIHDPDTGDILETNPRAAQLYGYSDDELHALSAGDLSKGEPPYSSSEAWEWLEKARLGGDPVFTWNARHKDGTLFWVEAHMRLADLGEGNRIVVSVRDITTRKKDEDELRQLRNYLANIVDSMPSVIIGVDAEGHVTLWNKRAADETGIPSEEAVGNSVERVFSLRTEDMEVIVTAIHESETQSLRRARRVRQGNQVIYLDIAVCPLDGAEGAVIRLDDVTERVRLEEMMIQSEKMLSVGGLAAGMAHEINNPLGGILQAATVLRERLTESLPANRQAAAARGVDLDAIRRYVEDRGVLKMLAIVEDSGRRAASIVRNMLSFARKSSDAQSVHDLNDLLRNTFDLATTDYDLKKRYDFRNILVIWELDEGIPPVACEQQKIQQVVLNLLKNAVEAMQAGRENGDMSADPQIRVRTFCSDGVVYFEIHDNGPGMSAEVCRRVFEPFYTTKPVGQGTGLGLSISYFIITENHGGSMSVTSEQGRGTCFTVGLPQKRSGSDEGESGSTDFG